MCQARVTLIKPATWRDAIRDIDKFTRIKRIEIRKDGLTHQVGVQGRNAVYLVTADDCQMRHAHALVTIFADDGHALEQLGITWAPVRDRTQKALVDFINDQQVARQYALEQKYRPGFQSLGKQRVVGVSEGARGEIPGFVPFKAMLVDQDTHQLGNRDGRVRVVQLDCDFVRQRVEAVVILGEAIQDVLQ